MAAMSLALVSLTIHRLATNRRPLNLLTNYLNHVIGTEVDFPKVDLVETVNA